jgi:creatinine amidohydrolase
MGGNARESDRRVGERMVADEVRWLGEKARELLAEYDRERPEHRLRTFEQVEQLWETVVRPALPQFRSMQELQPGQQAPAEGSVWRVNWRVPERG